jgi:hypothetical protein
LRNLLCNALVSLLKAFGTPHFIFCFSTIYGRVSALAMKLVSGFWAFITVCIDLFSESSKELTEASRSSSVF